MSWIFSKALMDSLKLPSLQESAVDCCPVKASESEPSVQLSVMPTPHKFWYNDKMIDHSTLSRFGLTFAVLTERTGEALILSQVASHVKTSALQEKAQGSKGKGPDSGQKWSELLAIYDPDMFSWRMSQHSLLEDLELSLETFTKCGMTRNGRAYQRQKLERITSGTAFGFYVPTPTASDGTSGSVFGKEDTYYKTSSGNTRRMTRTGWDRPLGLGRLVNMWPTLGPITKEKESGYWLTPSTVNIAERSDQSMKKRLDYRKKIGRNGAGAGCLSEQIKWSGDGPPISYMSAKNWPTPDASPRGARAKDLIINGSTVKRRNSGQSRGIDLQTAVQHASEEKKWPTPRASEYKDTGPVGSKSHKHMLEKDYLCAVTKEEAMPTAKLSADWTEWLMGFPVGWSDLEALPGEAQTWEEEPEGVPRVVIKQKYRALRLKGIGNAQVPQCAAEAYMLLLERFNE